MDREARMNGVIANPFGSNAMGMVPMLDTGAAPAAAASFTAATPAAPKKTSSKIEEAKKARLAKIKQEREDYSRFRRT